jgi:hypothetical protein
MSLINSMTRLALRRWMLKGCMRSFMRETIGASNAIQYLHLPLVLQYKLRLAMGLDASVLSSVAPVAKW